MVTQNKLLNYENKEQLDWGKTSTQLLSSTVTEYSFAECFTSSFSFFLNTNALITLNYSI